MRNGIRSFVVMIVFIGLISYSVAFSQESAGTGFNSGVDFYSSFIWRGTKYGTGPAIQPMIEFTAGSFTAGAWGSFDFRGYQETDLYFSFSLPAGFSLGMTDYYSPDLRYFDYSRISGSHAFELNLGFSNDNISLSANYILNEAGGMGSLGNDLYFQVGYSLKFFSMFIGTGNGWLTYESDTDTNYFNICNLGLDTSKTIKISDSFNIPFTAQMVLNPNKEQLFIVVGFTL